MSAHRDDALAPSRWPDVLVAFAIGAVLGAGAVAAALVDRLLECAP